jgi:hypothetical protein
MSRIRVGLVVADQRRVSINVNVEIGNLRTLYVGIRRIGLAGVRRVSLVVEHIVRRWEDPRRPN